MKTTEYLYGIVLLVVVQLACFSFIFHLHTWLGKYTINNLDQLYDPTSTELFEEVFLAILLAGLIGLVKYIKKSISPDAISYECSFRRWYFPAIEEFFKVGTIYFVYRRSVGISGTSSYVTWLLQDTGDSNIKRQLSIKQVATVCLVFNLARFSYFSYRFSPISYKKFYSEFIELFEMWREHTNVTKLSGASNDVKVDAAKALSESLNADTRTLYSKHSMNTLNNMPRMISIPSIKNPKAQPFKSKGSLSSVSDESDSVDLTSCYNMVDKLYSVSPKNSYHLNTDTVISISVDELEPSDDLFNSGKDDTHTNATPGQEISTVHYNNSENPGHSSSIPSIGRNINDSSYRQSSASLPTNSNSLNTLTPFVNWFSWLSPHSSCSVRNDSYLNTRRKNLQRNIAFDPTIKKTLSSYKLRRNSNIDSDTLSCTETLLSPYSNTITTYSAIDLEEQVSDYNTSRRNERNNRFEFKCFMDDYLDYSNESRRILIDPSFENFGSILPELSITKFLIWYSNDYLWNSCTFLIYAYPFISNSFCNIYLLFIVIFVLKLFHKNYLQNTNRSVQFTLIIESIINLSLFFCSILLLLFGQLR